MNTLTTKASQKDWTVTTSTTTGLCTQVLDSTGNLWVADYSQDHDKNGNVYCFDKDGKLLSTLSLPQPAGPTSFTPQAQTLLIVKDLLWMADFALGIIYRFNTKAPISGGKAVADMVYISPAVTGSMPRVQFWGLASQPASVETGSIDLIWFDDINSGTLFAIDAGSKAITSSSANPAPLVNLNIVFKYAKSARDIIYDEKNRVLWIVVRNESSPSECVLQRVPAKTSVKSSEIKTIPIEGALSLAMFKSTLAVGTDDGKIYTLGLTDADPAPLMLVELPKGTLTSNTPIIDYLTLDAAEHIWAVDTNEQGELYEITPDGQLVTQYKLQDTSNKTLPGSILWSPERDTFYIADQQLNGRVMIVTPPAPIDASGKASYTLTAQPDNGTTEPSHLFKSFNLTAKSTSSGNPGVFVNAILTVHGTAPATAQFADGRGELPVSIPVSGYKVDTLKAGPNAGTITVHAKSRGLADQTLYTGKVNSVVTNLKITAPNKTGVLAQQNFNMNGSHIEITPEDLTRTITLKIDKASDAVFAGGKTETTITSGKELPPIKAGKKAGPVTLTAEVDGKQATITLQVIPVPRVVKVTRSGSIHRTGSKLLDIGTFNLWGYKIDEDTTSDLLPIENWKITLKLNSISNGVKFSGGDSEEQVVITTDSKGQATLKNSHIELYVPNNIGEFSITYSVVKDEADARPVIIDQLVVTIVK